MKTSVLQKKELAIASSLFIFIPKRRPLERTSWKTRRVGWFCSGVRGVFSVYTVSGDTYDNNRS